MSVRLMNYITPQYLRNIVNIKMDITLQLQIQHTTLAITIAHIVVLDMVIPKFLTFAAYETCRYVCCLFNV